MNKKDVIEQLQPDEPDYEVAARLGADALPFLSELVGSADPMMASKAAYLAGLIGGDAGEAIVVAAAEHKNPEVRAAAVSASAMVTSETRNAIRRELSGDPDAAVARYAQRIADEASETMERPPSQGTGDYDRPR